MMDGFRLMADASEETVILRRIAPEVKQLTMLYAEREGSLAQARALIRLLPNCDTCLECHGRVLESRIPCPECGGRNLGAWLRVMGLEKLGVDLGLQVY